MNSHQRCRRPCAPGPIGLYKPSYEKDSCGVGSVVDIKGRAQRRIVTEANKVLVRLTHRGAKQGEDGDGAGILVGIPHRYFKKLSISGQLPFSSLPPAGRYGVGMIFLPNGEGSEKRRAELMDNIEKVIQSFGLSVLGWRSPLPTKSTILGPVGRATEPFPAQLFVCLPEDNVEEDTDDFAASRRTFSLGDDSNETYIFEPLSDDYDHESSFSSFLHTKKNQDQTTFKFPNDLEKILYLVRKRLAQWSDMYICSFSCSTIVYKGQLQSEQLFSYYDDLMNEDFSSYVAIVHSRFSTNTFPTWDRAHPFRRIAHNGEINTVESNRRWLVAKESAVKLPLALNYVKDITSLLPFEEPCHVPSFTLPHYPDRFINHDMKKRGEPPVACGGVQHVRDSLAVPTDVVSAHQNPVISNDVFSFPKEDTEESNVFESESELDYSFSQSDSFEETNNIQHSSDSALFDGIVDLLMMTGRDIVESLMLLIPEALGKFEPQWKHDYCDYNSCIMEPWDGPALVAFSDGQQFGALLDRNGLRPGRYMITTDDILILSSEVGVVDTPSSMILKKGRVLPGKMILVDFREQRVLYDEEIKKKYALKYPYGKWLEQNAIRLSCLPTEPMTENKIYQYCYGKRELVQTDTICILDFVKNSHATFETSPRAFQNVNDYGCSIATSKQYDFIKPVSENAYKTLFDIKLTPQQIMFGYTLKRFRVLLCCIFHCPINPLLDDKQQTFLACFSNSHKTPGDYFHQVFAQGTNPSVDPIRETDIMSLVCPIGPQQDLFSITEKHAERIFLNTPILLPQDYQLLINLSKYSTSTIDLTIEISYKGFNLQHALETIREKAAQAVREGCQLLILSDVKAGSNRLPIWCTLAVGAVHLYLIQHGLRLKCAIIVETGEVYQIHQAALLLSTGADAIYPYLVYQTLCEVYFRMTPKVMSLSQLLNSYITYINYGLLQVMSRIGICTMLSYKGGFFFQPMGIATNVLSFCFDAGTAPIGGVDFNIFAKDALAFHIEAYPSSFSSYYPLTKEPNINILQNPLFFAPLDNNDELTHAKVFNSLQQFIQTTSYDTYQHFSKMKNALTDETEIRGQFDFALHCCTPISLDDVESPFEILKRFVFSSSASHWVKKPNIHSSNRFFDTVDLPHPKVINLSDAMKLFTRGIKCIGSTRFSVNPSSLFNANELQIDCSQRAILMPSYDVSTLPLNMYRSLNIENYVNLNSICPPPHYDMYSIEDVAQLIMDLKHSNPRARISINLTSKLGVGVIAVGCMKAKADHIIISGSPHHTTKNEFHYLGLPWEIGLAETHQTLCLNGLRNRVSLQVNGGLSTGRDVIVAALLGAEEFGFETCSMLSLNNTTDSFNSMMPSSLTQQENEFFKQFEGPARHLVYYFYMVAQEVRLYMAQLGFHEFNQMIGRSDLLCPKQSMQCHWKRSGFDFHQTLMPGWKLVSPINRWLCSSDQFVPRSMHCMMAQDHELDKVLDREIIRRAKSSLEHRIKTFMLFPIRNVDRSVGGLLSHEIIKRYGSETLPHETIKVHFRGAAGQSFACWLPKGVTFYLSGECNDFAGKGLSGGILIVKPPSDSPFLSKTNENIICGNSTLYGATSGQAFFAGVAGERFAVRNSGAIAVIEGCGDYACQSMTSGTVLILGKTGRCLADGITGGVVYVLDLNLNFINTNMVQVQTLLSSTTIMSYETLVKSQTSQDTIENSIDKEVFDSPNKKSIAYSGDMHFVKPGVTDYSHDVQTIIFLLKEHSKNTKSSVSQQLLQSLPECLCRFSKIVPKQKKHVLKKIIIDYIFRIDNPDTATLFDDWDDMPVQSFPEESVQFSSPLASFYNYKYQRCERLRRRMESLNIHEDPQSMSHSCLPPLHQYITDLKDYYKDFDLLSDTHKKQFHRLMKEGRMMYSYWRKGLSKGFSDRDIVMIKVLLPSSLTSSRRAFLKKYFLEAKKRLYQHLHALEDLPLAEILLNIGMSQYPDCTFRTKGHETDMRF